MLANGTAHSLEGLHQIIANIFSLCHLAQRDRAGIVNSAEKSVVLFRNGLMFNFRL